jgi:hypothetical protein
MKLTDVYKLLPGPIRLEKVVCQTTGFKVEGPFQTPALFQLQEEQLELVEKLALHGGNLTKAAIEMGVSHPTLRNRLREISDFLAKQSEANKQKRLEILKQIEDGALSPEEGAERLAEL